MKTTNRLEKKRNRQVSNLDTKKELTIESVFSQERDGRLSEMLGILGIFAQVGEVDVGMLPPAERDDRLQLRICLFVILFGKRRFCLKGISR